MVKETYFRFLSNVYSFGRRLELYWCVMNRVQSLLNVAFMQFLLLIFLVNVIACQTVIDCRSVSDSMCVFRRYTAVLSKWYVFNLFCDSERKNV